MIEVTEADKKLLQDLAINIREGGSRHDREQLVATHREAAAKAERDRLRDLPDDVVAKAAKIGYVDEYSVKMIATALADALESQHD